MEKKYVEQYYHFFPESDKGVRAKTSDGEIVMDLKTALILAGDALRIEVYCVDTTGVNLVCTREYEMVKEEELKRFPSEKALAKIFGGRTKTVANGYPILSNISKLTIREFYEYVEENMGVFK